MRTTSRGEWGGLYGEAEQCRYSQELIDLDPVHSLQLETLARRLLTSIPSREDSVHQKLCICYW